jgi:hypothetical protein
MGERRFPAGGGSRERVNNGVTLGPDGPARRFAVAVFGGPVPESLRLLLPVFSAKKSFLFRFHNVFRSFFPKNASDFDWLKF